MLRAPFVSLLPLIVFDGGFHHPQDTLRGLADGASKGRGHGGRVKLKDALKILPLEGFLRGEITARQEGPGDADGGGASKGGLHVQLIVFLQIASLDGVQNFLTMVVPKRLRKTAGDFFQTVLYVQSVWRFRFAERLIKCRRHRSKVLAVVVLPEPRGFTVCAAPGVGKVEHIAGYGNRPGVVQQDDGGGVTPDVTVQTVPCLELRTGCGVGTLGVNEQLVLIGPFVQPSGGGEKRGPLRQAVCKLDSRLRRDLRVIFRFIRHSYRSLLVLFLDVLRPLFCPFSI
ncbi:MAG: hypothetical protein J6X53_02645 [Abditibacteriota bacterium]|nr:hypothetical protein [Abditibacteriota bacterium]